MVVTIGINGFGRIGRVLFRTCLQHSETEVLAINDPAISAEYICYLIKYDSTHGKFFGSVSSIINENDIISVNGKKIKIFHQSRPSCTPWHSVGIEYVIEASGMFTSQEKASGHINEGVKRVIVTAPSVDIPMIILGVNEQTLDPDVKVISCTSSTLYCLAPIIKILEDTYGVVEGFITSIHAMTPSLKPLDGLCLRGKVNLYFVSCQLYKHWRDHRSIHQNIIPASTGACKALGKIIPEVKDKLTGLAFRVPIVNVSVLDLTVRLNKATTLQDIIKNVTNQSGIMRNIMRISTDEAVSSDFIGETHSCIVDVVSSLQLKPNFFKLICWYENEFSYACRIVDTILHCEQQFLENENLSQLKNKVLTSLKIRDQKSKTDKKLLATRIFDDIKNPNKRIKFTTSQEAEDIEKFVIQLGISKEPTTTTKTFNSNKSSFKQYELFKIWNEDSQVVTNKMRQNRSSFFQSCMAFAPQKPHKNICSKAQERLEKVKQEFSKMADITEDLLNKSCSNKLNTAHSSIEENDSNNSNNESYKNGQKLENSQTINEECGDFFEYHKSKNLTSEEHLENEFSNNNSLKPWVQHSTVRHFQELDSKKIFSECSEDLNKKDSVSSKTSSSNSFKQVTQSINNLISGFKQNLQLSCSWSSQSKQDNNEVRYKADNKINMGVEGVNKTLQASTSVNLNVFDRVNKSISSKDVQSISDVKTVSFEKPNHFMKAISTIDHLEEELKKRNIVLVSSHKDISPCAYLGSKKALGSGTEVNDKFIPSLPICKEPIYETSINHSPTYTSTTISNGDLRRYKQDIYDKLDSASVTDSENSFQIHERKSQILNIQDLTNSFDDLIRLDKICRIIEISDDLSNELFSALDNPSEVCEQKNAWSFKDLCERIKLDEFCNKVFGQINM